MVVEFMSRGQGGRHSKAEALRRNSRLEKPTTGRRQLSGHRSQIGAAPSLAWEAFSIRRLYKFIQARAVVIISWEGVRTGEAGPVAISALGGAMRR